MSLSSIHGNNVLKDFPPSDSYAVYSFTRKMHEVKKRRSARPQAEWTSAGSEDTDSEEEPEGEMNSFQDLQLGSMAPLVRHEDDSS